MSRRIVMAFLATVVVIVCGSKLVSATETWQQFRGPRGDGRAASDSVTMDLNASTNLRWRLQTPGTGWSSPVLHGDMIWITAAETTAATREQIAAKLANVQFAQIKGVVASATLRVLGVDANTGRLIVNRVLANVNDPGPIHPMNGFASPTPAVAGDKVICHFGQYGTFCLDAGSGETLWTQTLPCDDSVGPGSSPVVVGDNVIITCDGIDQQYVAALSLADGTLAWRTSRPPMRTSNVEFQKAYCTPTIVDVDGQTQVIITGAQWCVAYDPMSGKEIWRFDHGSGFSVATMALPVGDVVVFSSGYTSPELFAIEPTGQGNVTSTHLRWRMARNVPTKPSLASDGKLLYVISDDGILSAVSVIDGSQVYRQRIGGMFSSSPFISGDRVLIGNHEGEVTIFQTGSQYHQVARFDLGDQIMASPVPVGDDLLIRTKAELMRFGPSR